MENERTENIFTSTWSMSISMVVQNFSPIRCFLHNKLAQNMPAEEKKTTKKKSRQTHRGSRRDGMPQWMYMYYVAMLKILLNMLNKEENWFTNVFYKLVYIYSTYRDNTP